ncbi:stalk domain-containing protein [Saccharibacillus sp. JS10]|uniref:stalk domain-containing protein n=1 Tax=Saccharibacillus sp. JS10 TaxID=2950552 RepID=UPI00210EF1D1|nr:stalk domain-containing protein [Saccharibacillus sp. JS10]MCQ4086465.1 copper amine oxidase N-terminal domain-containing protein [Saccharibacillus sp. JS10]
MKKKLTAAAIGVALTLTASAGVYAGANIKEIRASLNYGLGIVVNGKTYAPKDGNGKTLAPITYNGTTYLPVRSIGEALNTSVTYDAKNSRVVIGGSASSGSTGGSSSVQRPSSIPADFPLTSDAKVFDLIQGSSGATGKPSATFSYTTKQSLLTLGNTYKQYFAKKGATSKFEEVSASSITIIDSSGTFSVTIDGKPGTGSRKGFNVVDVVWSGK